MKITSEIFQVGGGEMTSMEDAAVYLINFGGHAALVDAGCGRNQEILFKNIGECGIKPELIEYLFITHCHYDHTGGALDVKERTGCRIVAHELDAIYLEKGDDTVTAAKWYGAGFQPLQVDYKITGDQEQIDLGGRIVEAIHVPGHSPGSMVYLTESDGLKVLFGQDVHGPLDGDLLSDRDDYIRSLNLLIGLDADILCEGHYGIFKGREEVTGFIQSFL